MSENPYHSPLPPEEPVSLPAPTRSARLSVMACLLFASLITAGLVTPADPASSFLASIPIFGLCMGAYYYGLRHGSQASLH